MKRVLVLNGDSYVGRHVVKAFHESQEYDVEITRTRSDARRASTTRATTTAGAQGWMWSDAMARDSNGLPTTSAPHGSSNSPHARKKKSRNNNGNHNSTMSLQQQQEAEERANLPLDIRPCVSGVVPKHNDDTEVFRTRLLANDVVVAVLEDDIYEATCAIRILESTHYEVEKTFVLVSSAVTWAYTLESERAKARLTRQRERAEARNTFLEEKLDEEEEARGEGGDDTENESPAAAAARAVRRAARRRALEERLPFSFRDPLPGEDEDEIRELVPDRVLKEDGYAQRVPHPRFQHWHALEHMVKRANTQTLHTYVVFAGMPYGAGEGEGMLYGLLRSAWYHQVLHQYGPGANAIPMIHVQDLAAILFKLGNSYDTLEERYLFAVDQGKITQRQLLHAVQAKLGGSVQPATSNQCHLLPTTVPVTATATTTATPATFGRVAGISASQSGGNGPSASVSTNTHPAAGAAAGSPTTITSTTSVTITTSTISANLVKLDRLELPLPLSPPELFRVFGNAPCWGDGSALLSAFVLSDMQAEPAAVLSFYPAEEWVALGGFAVNLDLVLAQFREAHAYAFRPVRMLITGPPLSGAESLAVLVARQCHTPVLTLPTIVNDYKAHVEEVREALRQLLVRRLERRRARVQARLVRQAVEEKMAQRAARAERQGKRQAAKQAKETAMDVHNNDEDDGEDGEQDGEDDVEAAKEGEGAGDDGLSGQQSLNASISVFIPQSTAKEFGEREDHESGDDGEDAEDSGVRKAKEIGSFRQPHTQPAPARPAEEVVDEAYIRGAAAMGHGGSGDVDPGDVGGGHDVGGMIDEEQEEVGEDSENGTGTTWLGQLEEQDAVQQAEMLEGQELLPEGITQGATTTAAAGQPFQMPRFAARRRGRAFARDVDRQELRCITALRREYLLGLKVLALKVSLSDGRLPRPPPPPSGYGDDNNAEENETESVASRNNKKDNGAVRGKLQQVGNDDDDEDELAESSNEESDDDDGDAAAAVAAEEEVAEEEEDESSSDATDENGGEGEKNCEGYDALSTAEEKSDDDASSYLDHALAFMLRWRLRQSDCRCQGYVLGNFPQTLAQAVLCFKASATELEDAELRRQRALAPLLTRLDDHEVMNNGDAEGSETAPLPPPLDEDFPLPDITNMEEAQLRALERSHRRARGVADTPFTELHYSAEGEEEEGVASAAVLEPEEVMAPVDEALFVEHVVSLQANSTLLLTTVEMLETDLKTNATAAAASEQQQQQPGQSNEAHALRALCSVLSATPYARRLDDYLRHHAQTAPPTQSLLAWLSAVTTTPTLGARPAPVITSFSGDAAAAGGVDGLSGSSGVATTLEAPSTTRTAQIVTLPAPVLSVPQVKASWCVAYAASHPCANHHQRQKGNSYSKTNMDKEEGAATLLEKLPVALLRLAPLFWTSDVPAGSSLPSLLSASPGKRPYAHCTTLAPGRVAASAKGAELKVLPLSLKEVQRALCAGLVPQRRLAACVPAMSCFDGVTATATRGGGSSQLPLMPVSLLSVATAPTSSSHRHINSVMDGNVEEMNSLSTISRERVQLTKLEKREMQLADLASRENAAQVLQEDIALRKLQLTEYSHDAAALLQMPVEAYLMKYVLPSLTPAMTEVVRLRSDDPVTALANVLFDYHRRTTI